MSNDVLLEIGLEELPARFIDNAMEQLVEHCEHWLHENRLKFDKIIPYSTPRRLAIIVENIADSQETLSEEVRGPSKQIAQNEDGTWTKAAIGFAKGQGKTVDDLYVKDLDGIPYIFVKKVVEGEKTENVLQDIKNIITSIQFPQTMYWDRELIAYARPIRWITALYEDEVIPFEIANIKADRKTFGHRFLGSEISLANPKEYLSILEQHYVIADMNKRENMIVKGIKTIEKENNFTVYENKELLREVTHLVEYPTVFHGVFDKDFLELPEEVLITAMEEHQRYFSVMTKAGKLLPYFVAVRNGDETAISQVIRGNEKVLDARLSDARFFYEEDLKLSLSEYVDALGNVIFQEDLGTYEAKVNRTKQIALEIAKLLNLSENKRTKLERAAELSKFDLVTLMVNEFPELQGIIGEKYALKKGEDKIVAQAIKEHYYPVKSNGQLPSNDVSSILSVADKLDTIVGIITVGLVPTGSQDPYALRRQGFGILRILKQSEWDISFEQLLNITLRVHGKEEVNREKITQFFKLRAQHILKDLNIESDIVKSVMKHKIGHFIYTINKASLLSEKRKDPKFKPTEEALVRAINIAKHAKNTSVDEQLFQTDSEKDLYDKYKEISKKYYRAAEDFNAQQALNHLSNLTEVINEFFEENLVMDDDEDIKNNRLALLKNIAKIVDHFADLTEIQWKQRGS